MADQVLPVVNNLTNSQLLSDRGNLCIRGCSFGGSDGRLPRDVYICHFISCFDLSVLYFACLPMFVSVNPTVRALAFNFYNIRQNVLKFPFVSNLTKQVYSLDNW